MHLLNLGYTHAKMDPTIPKHKQIQRLPRKTIENHRKHRKNMDKTHRFSKIPKRHWSELSSARFARPLERRWRHVEQKMRGSCTMTWHMKDTFPSGLCPMVPLSSSKQYEDVIPGMTATGLKHHDSWNLKFISFWPRLNRWACYI